MFKWHVILSEEVGEFAKECLDNSSHISDNVNYSLRKEIVQVAAVALQIIECIDRNVEKDRGVL